MPVVVGKFNHNGQTVMLAPATGFYSKPELGRKEVRIAYVLNLEDLKHAMDCLREALLIYPGRIVENPREAVSQ